MCSANALLSETTKSEEMTRWRRCAMVALLASTASATVGCKRKCFWGEFFVECHDTHPSPDPALYCTKIDDSNDKELPSVLSGWQYYSGLHYQPLGRARIRCLWRSGENAPGRSTRRCFPSLSPCACNEQDIEYGTYAAWAVDFWGTRPWSRQRDMSVLVRIVRPALRRTAVRCARCPRPASAGTTPCSYDGGYFPPRFVRHATDSTLSFGFVPGWPGIYRTSLALWIEADLRAQPAQARICWHPRLHDSSDHPPSSSTCPQQYLGRSDEPTCATSGLLTFSAMPTGDNIDDISGTFSAIIDGSRVEGEFESAHAYKKRMGNKFPVLGRGCKYEPCGSGKPVCSDTRPNGSSSTADGANHLVGVDAGRDLALQPDAGR